MNEYVHQHMAPSAEMSAQVEQESYFFGIQSFSFSLLNSEGNEGNMTIFKILI